MTGVIILNGPPRSGKDTAVDIICDLLEKNDEDMYDVKMAQPAYDAVPVLFGIPKVRWHQMYYDKKDVPHEELWGMSPRRALIWLCEEVMKPKFGADYFGVIAGKKAGRLSSKSHWVTISDGGFPHEIQAVVDRCEHPVYLVHVHRAGCDFKSDSRGYVQPDEVGIPSSHHFQLCNYASVEDFKLATEELFRRITDET